MTYGILGLIYAIASCVICVKLASQKNKKTTLAGIAGFFLGVFAILYYGFTSKEEPKVEEQKLEGKSNGVNTNGNVYTFCYAAVMVIIVAFLLAFVASALKSTQEANVANDTKGQILSALGYDKASVDVAKVYEEKVKDNLFEAGELKPYEGKFNTTYGSLIKDGQLHVFTGTTAEGEQAYVLPVVGRGLWGGLWGYIAVNEAKDKVLGTYFYHESETAGLGARISEKWFQDQFNGKPIFGEDGNVALTVTKAGAAQSEFEVDGVTGATLTSNGVAAMVKEGLTAYKEFLGGAVASEPEEEAETECIICEEDVKQ